MSLLRKARSVCIALGFVCAVLLPGTAEAGRRHVRRVSHRAYRQVSRRTARRISHQTYHRALHRTVRTRTARVYRLPHGYTTMVKGGKTYYYADGVYYEALFVDGRVVYVVADV